MRKKVLESVYELAKKNDKILFIGSDLGPQVLKDFKKEFPERFFMEGAAEQHLISMASGLALEGFIPYVNTIATFLTRRCFEQITLNLGLQKTKVRLIANGGGLVYSPLGPTHLAIDDIALMRAIPNMTIVAPSDENEMEKFMKKTIDYPGPIYIRVAKGGDPIVSNIFKDDFEIGKIYSINESCENLIFTTGITLNIALRVKESLLKNNIDVGIIHVPTIKPLNNKAISKITKNTKRIFTIEEHSIIGGLGSAISELILESNPNNIEFFKRIGIKDIFPKGYGRQHNMMEKYKIDFDNCLTIIEGILNG